MNNLFKDKDGNEQPVVHRTLTPEVKIIDAAKGILDYVASDETLDHHGEVVKATGWKFSHFRKNSPFLNSHRSYDISDVLGKVLSAEVNDGQLVERVQWALGAGHDAAEVGWKLTEAGFLKAVSVGFYSTKRVSRWSDESAFAAEVSEMGMAAEDAAQLRTIHLEQEQLELSAVVIGANPNALAKGFQAGAIGEEDLARLGFGGDEEFDFLAKAAEAVSAGKADQVFRKLIAIEMGRIYDTRKTFRGKQAATGTSPGTPSGGGDVERKAAKRAEFLTKLAALSK